MRGNNYGNLGYDYPFVVVFDKQFVCFGCVGDSRCRGCYEPYADVCV